MFFLLSNKFNLRLLSSKQKKLMPVGLTIIHALKFRLLSLKENFPNRIDLRLNTIVVGLVTWNEYVTGVRFKNHEGKIGENRLLSFRIFYYLIF